MLMSVIAPSPQLVPHLYLVELALIELRQAAFLAGRDARVRAIDITEIDAALDTPDQRTIRLVLCLCLRLLAV